MAKMLGRAGHDPQCDCNSQHVGPDRCGGTTGRRRARKNEKRTWQKEAAADSKRDGGEA